MAPTELHRSVETFLDVVWPYDKLWKYSPGNFLSNAPTLVVIRQLLKGPTYLVQKVHFSPPKKSLPLNCPGIMLEKYRLPWVSSFYHFFLVPDLGVLEFRLASFFKFRWVLYTSLWILGEFQVRVKNVLSNFLRRGL